MTINGWDISEAESVQWNVTPGFHSISNDSEWVRGSPMPVLIGNTTGFKSIKVTLLVKADRDRQAILQRCSRILSHLLEPAELELDDFTHKFYGILAKHSLEENSLNVLFVKFNRAAKLTLEFSCYEYADMVTQTFTGQTQISVTNPGNIVTPVRVEITPQTGVASTVITGLCREAGTGKDLPVTIGELVTGKNVILDGETGLFTQDGEVKKELEIWGLPALLPGINTITVNNSWTDITLKYRPRFM